MAEPTASRPYMPGYGLLDAEQGSGLLPWSWAVERLERSHDYWVATTRPDGRPHVMPVWGVWIDNAYEPVVSEGEATLIDDRAAISAFVAALNQKYQTDYAVDFFNPTENACFRVPPTWAFGLTEADFAGTPTRWTFPPTTAVFCPINCDRCLTIDNDDARSGTREPRDHVFRGRAK